MGGGAVFVLGPDADETQTVLVSGRAMEGDSDDVWSLEQIRSRRSSRSSSSLILNLCQRKTSGARCWLLDSF